MAQRFRTALSTSFELLSGIWRGPYWWLAPVIAILLPAAAIFVLVQAVPVVAPFVYALF